MTPIWLSQLRDRIRSIFPFGTATGFPDTFPDEVKLVDRRKTAIQAHGPERQWKVYDRPWKKVTGITLHQTACVLGERDERWDTVGAHLGITRSGKVEWLHNFNRVVAHGNGWNDQCVGIEIDGLFPGLIDDPSTVWDDPSTAIRELGMTVTDAQVFTTIAVIEWVQDTVEANGGHVRALVSHRQSSDSRQNDPGEEVWKRIALPAMQRFGLDDGGYGFKIGTGRPNPEKWDPSRVGIKY